MFGYKAFEDGFSMKITFTKWFSDNDEKSFRVGVFFVMKKYYFKMCIASNWYEKKTQNMIWEKTGLWLHEYLIWSNFRVFIDFMAICWQYLYHYWTKHRWCRFIWTFLWASMNTQRGWSLHFWTKMNHFISW